MSADRRKFLETATAAVAGTTIIYSGTPENADPVVPGDLMGGHIDGLYEIRVKVV